MVDGPKTFKRQHPCANCCPDYRVCWSLEPSRGEDDGWEWECNNCRRREPFRPAPVPAKSAEVSGVKMTRAQAVAIWKLHDSLLRGYSDSTQNEVKVFEVTDNGRDTICARLEVGRIGDEGTMASVFCRDRVQAFIGVSGGVSTYSTRKLKGGGYRTKRVEGFRAVLATRHGRV